MQFEKKKIVVCEELLYKRKIALWAFGWDVPSTVLQEGKCEVRAGHSKVLAGNMPIKKIGPKLSFYRAVGPSSHFKSNSFTAATVALPSVRQLLGKSQITTPRGILSLLFPLLDMRLHKTVEKVIH